MSRAPRAVVFAYHSVGVRALRVLLELGVEIPLIVTHRDDSSEQIWFDSVRELADWAGIPCLMPEDPNTPEMIAAVRARQPHWLLSFYYRHLLGDALLAIPTRGALNLHGSLLPKYRGRAPLNWALVHGERETGMSLHRMVRKPDAGALIDQEPAPIFPNDTAVVVMARLLCAGERLLLRALPELFAGTAGDRPLDLHAGSYFGGRRPEDGRINPAWPVWRIHNLIRAVAPPYPGAFVEIQGQRLDLLGSWYQGEAALGCQPRLYWQGGRCWFDGADGERLRLTRIELAGQALTRQHCQNALGTPELTFPS